MGKQNNVQEKYYFDHVEFTKHVLGKIDDCFPNMEHHEVGEMLKADPMLQQHILDFINGVSREIHKKRRKNFLTVVK